MKITTSANLQPYLFVESVNLESIVPKNLKLMYDSSNSVSLSHRSSIAATLIKHFSFIIAFVLLYRMQVCDAIFIRTLVHETFELEALLYPRTQLHSFNIDIRRSKCPRHQQLYLHDLDCIIVICILVHLASENIKNASSIKDTSHAYMRS